MANKKPNVVIIFADDLGYGDVSCFNPESKIKTKNMDKLAEVGMRFTDTHATSALCTPSRYGLLTGRYNWRSSLKSYVVPGDSMLLIEENRKTIAHLLKDNGYNTAAIGKWHLGLKWQLKDHFDYEKFGLNPDEIPGKETRFGRDGIFDISVGRMDFEGLDIDYSKPITFGPNQLGFDYFYGTPASLDQPPFVYIENDRVVEEATEVTGTAMLDRTGVTDQTEWQNGVAAPNFVHREVPDNMQKKALEVIDRFTEDDKPFFLYYPNHLVHGPLIPNEQFEGKSGIGPYGDFVLQLDHYVGEIVDKLKEKGIFEDTIFILSSDNGASGVADFEGLKKHGHNPSYIFKGIKGDIWEGGHREPTIISYPPMIQGGTASNHMISQSDIYRSIAEIIGAKITDDTAEDSISNIPLWQGKNESVREDIVHSSANGGFSIRRGDWKLELVYNGGGLADSRKGAEGQMFQPAELYDLKEDISETNNLIHEHPELVKSLKESLKEYIVKGRSTPGEPQENNRNNPSGEWPQIRWMDGYEEYIARFKYD
ncbi:sulfatase-like hydrolase/transferase [Oceanobacillus rekensis]|uniref:sulfatase-like hydrolase/transferase n=1 Tax=Oceanobacillus rekensis TaxID=937927 RepID=UPI000B42DC69|nr:sulfatase-like hydrolase/transferase [Oceanobacillus rekensis]